ncbi:peroxidase 16 [Cinnamomum micranthum f. kanehirae]|uniref:Peroxidase 16 n=1 Tax=Cinnamomum micranthum f. kanehirae TaxID=337451 RepID=A0A3S3M1C0_9MAGN|nr:peroxidase 16 [Cinnamomum micranthum f. kanehirae]
MDVRSRNTANHFAKNNTAFYHAFVPAIRKLGRVGVETGNQGEIRRDYTFGRMELILILARRLRKVQSRRNPNSNQFEYLGRMEDGTKLLEFLLGIYGIYQC